MIIFLFKVLCILIPLILIYVSGHSQGGVLTAQVNSSDTSYSIYIANTPTNTYGNRINLFQLNKGNQVTPSSFSLKVKNFRLDSFLIGRNDSSPDYFLGNDAS